MYIYTLYIFVALQEKNYIPHILLNHIHLLFNSQTYTTYDTAIKRRQRTQSQIRCVQPKVPFTGLAAITIWKLWLKKCCYNIFRNTPPLIHIHIKDRIYQCRTNIICYVMYKNTVGLLICWNQFHNAKFMKLWNISYNKFLLLYKQCIP